MRIAVVFLSVLVLTGCVGSDPPVTPAPTPTSTPLFASDAEALKAAEAAYKRFNDVADEILHEGGADPDRLKAVATGSLLSSNITGFKSYQAMGYRSIGSIASSDFRLEQLAADRKRTVTVYVCEDVSGVDVIDSSGKSVVPASRPDRQTMEIGFDSVAPGVLVASSKLAWSDDC